MHHDDVLLIHMGGLGDMCLSESTFLSLSKHFQKNISALGYPRFFKFFQGYFQTIYSIESAKWLYLFSDYPSETTWKRIVFIGKDRNGELRRRWQAISEEELIFIDMYPGSIPDSPMDDRPALGGTKTTHDHSSRITRDSLGRFENASLVSRPSSVAAAVHIEDYQLMQLDKYGVRPIKKDITSRPRNRVILYPEIGVTKSKWHHKNFIEVYHSLKKRGIEAYILESLGLDLAFQDKISIEDLGVVQTFFNDGGIFVSNDSGMAHFAGVCGLFTITIFSDFDPAIWHPRGWNISLRQGIDHVDVPELEALIMKVIDHGKG
jgi:ADP-heptose:LPS heptosyltransferase